MDSSYLLKKRDQKPYSTKLQKNILIFFFGYIAINRKKIKLFFQTSLLIKLQKLFFVVV